MHFYPHDSDIKTDGEMLQKLSNKTLIGVEQKSAEMIFIFIVF